MATSSVTVTISENTFLRDTAEPSSAFTAGILLSGMTLINACGTTTEVGNSYMSIRSVDEWWARLNLNTGNSAGYTFEGFGPNGALYPTTHGVAGASGKTADQVRWPLGATGEWKTAWFTVHSYLKYGGGAEIGLTSSPPFTTNQTPMNVAFDGDGANDSALATILTNRSSDIMICRSITSKTGSSSGNKYHTFVYGTKQIIPLGSNEESESIKGFITVPLTSDLAGCMARTYRVAHPWYSPAGFNRGRILDVFRLPNPLTAAEADTLYDNGVNPVLYFHNQGHVLFGDKTGAAQKINITKLFIYLEKEIGAIARATLFEINNSALRQSFINRVSSLLESVKTRQGISDYTIVCDKSNNSDAIINSGSFVADVYVKPINSVERVKLTFTNVDDLNSLG